MTRHDVACRGRRKGRGIKVIHQAASSRRYLVLHTLLRNCSYVRKGSACLLVDLREMIEPMNPRQKSTVIGHHDAYAKNRQPVRRTQPIKQNIKDKLKPIHHRGQPVTAITLGVY